MTSRRLAAGGMPSATSTARSAPTRPHASTTDPDARLIRRGRGKEAKLCHMGHLLMENQSGLIVAAMLTTATGTAERAAAEALLAGQTGRHRATLGADKGYDAADFVAAVRALNVTPHIAQNTSRRSAIDGRTTRHPGYALSQRTRKRIEEAFGWIKTTGGFRKTRHRGTRPGRLAVHPHRRGLQLGPVAEAARGGLIMPAVRSVTPPPNLTVAPTAGSTPTPKSLQRGGNGRRSHPISAAC